MKIIAFENSNYKFAKTRTGYHVFDKRVNKWLQVIVSRKGCEKYQ